MLKTNGYNLEHNFGHGKQTLASVLVTLNLLAFAFHTAAYLGVLAWQAAVIAREGRLTAFSSTCERSRFTWSSTTGRICFGPSTWRRCGHLEQAPLPFRTHPIQAWSRNTQKYELNPDLELLDVHPWQSLEKPSSHEGLIGQGFASVAVGMPDKGVFLPDDRLARKSSSSGWRPDDDESNGVLASSISV